jgi:hypothetical protein
MILQLANKLGHVDIGSAKNRKFQICCGRDPEIVWRSSEQLHGYKNQTSNRPTEFWSFYDQDLLKLEDLFLET